MASIYVLVLVLMYSYVCQNYGKSKITKYNVHNVNRYVYRHTTSRKENNKNERAAINKTNVAIWPKWWMTLSIVQWVHIRVLQMYTISNTNTYTIRNEYNKAMGFNGKLVHWLKELGDICHLAPAIFLSFKFSFSLFLSNSLACALLRLLPYNSLSFVFFYS